jgi:hypothetical protein
MLWILLSFGIILILIAGMMVVAKLADNSGGQSWEILGNCRRGAVRLPARINLGPGVEFKGPR